MWHVISPLIRNNLFHFKRFINLVSIGRKPLFLWKAFICLVTRMFWEISILCVQLLFFSPKRIISLQNYLILTAFNVKLPNVVLFDQQFQFVCLIIHLKKLHLPDNIFACWHPKTMAPALFLVQFSTWSPFCSIYQINHPNKPYLANFNSTPNIINNICVCLPPSSFWYFFFNFNRSGFFFVTLLATSMFRSIIFLFTFLPKIH